MIKLCSACPNKGPLRRNFTQCVNCNSYYHISCANRIGYVSTGVVKKCCKNFNFASIAEDSSSADSFITSSPISEKLQESFICTDTVFNTTTMSPIVNLDDLWTKIENKLDTGIRKKLDDFIDSCNSRFNQLEQRLDEFEEKISEVQRRSKESSVIFKNVPDKNNDQSDTEFIVNLLNDNLVVFRLGKFIGNQQRPRLLKVRFQDYAVAQWLIHNGKKLNFPNGITCQSDQTPLQRRLIKKAILELNSREDKGENNLIIKYIHSIPKVMVTPQVGPSGGHTKPKSNFQNKGSKAKFKKQ